MLWLIERLSQEYQCKKTSSPVSLGPTSSIHMHNKEFTVFCDQTFGVHRANKRSQCCDFSRKTIRTVPCLPLLKRKWIHSFESVSLGACYFVCRRWLGLADTLKEIQTGVIELNGCMVHLMYADDLLIANRFEHELQQQCTQLEQASETDGLRISYQKTILAVFRRGERGNNTWKTCGKRGQIEDGIEESSSSI